METVKHYKISFIVASIDRDQELQQCIASVEKAYECSRKEIPIEILVVIQKTKQKKNIQICYPEIITFYYIDEIGLSVARNFAIAKSRGDYFVFLDDDATISEDFIDVLSKKIIVFNKVNAFCGRIIDPVQHIPFSKLFHNNDVKILRRFDYQYFMGSAHVLSREVIKRIGRYDERFGVGSKYYGSEESDIFFRLKAAKEEILYLPDLVFYHPIPSVLPRYVYNYAYAVGAVLTKNCVNDKAYFPLYCLIVLKMTVKASVRILQEKVFRGIYKGKNERYHYGALLRGTFSGIIDFIGRELLFVRN
ncbi:MAG: glycosyltransferase family 2 protein [Desulfobacteraceae bacterium]|nr:glycosyltransferase family 2 protein [Desulfobacteraceae bacterium]